MVSGRMEVKARSEPWTLSWHRTTKQWLETPGVLKIVQNGMFDVPRLRDSGINVVGPFWDTLPAAQRIDPDAPGFDLNSLIAHYLDTDRHKHLGTERHRPKKPKLQRWKKGKACKECGTDCVHGARDGKERSCASCVEQEYRRALDTFEANDELYNRRDSAVLVSIQEIQEEELRRTGQLESFRQEMEVFPLLVEMHMDGIKVDPGARNRAVARMGRWAEWAESEWKRSTGVSPSAFARIITLMYSEWKLPPKYKLERVGGRMERKLTSEDAAVQELLQEGGHGHRRELKLLLWARHFRKWISTYTEIQDRVHPSFGPAGKDSDTGGKKFATGTNTGRIVMKGGIFRGKPTPPMGTIPTPLRRMFVPEEGHIFVEVDDNSQELRIAAYYYYDPLLVERIESGFDIHKENAARWKVDRRRSKGGFYGAIYGSSGHGIQRAFTAEGHKVSLEFCQGIVADLKRQYPGVFAAQEELLRRVAVDHYVENPFGRRRYIWDVKRMRSEVINFPNQSIGGDMYKRRIKRAYEVAQEFGGRLKLGVYDSMLFSIPVSQAHDFIRAIRPVMEQKFPEVHPDFRVPADFKVGFSWGPGLRKWREDLDLSSLRRASPGHQLQARVP